MPRIPNPGSQDTRGKTHGRLAQYDRYEGHAESKVLQPLGDRSWDWEADEGECRGESRGKDQQYREGLHDGRLPGRLMVFHDAPIG